MARGIKWQAASLDTNIYHFAPHFFLLDLILSALLGKPLCCLLNILEMTVHAFLYAFLHVT